MDNKNNKNLERNIIGSNPADSTQVLPNFLVIGTMKSGTTWLYEILKNNPEVYLYEYVKEIHFFTQHYERGLEWYKKFFPLKNDAHKYKAIGEITPTYIVYDYVPTRVLKHIPNAKFIIVLRNPVTRAFSHYTYNKLNHGFKYTFEEYLKQNSRVYRYGLYSKQISKWFQYFAKDRFLILIFEEMFKEPIKALKKISNFLNIDFNKFNLSILKKKENTSYIPRLHKIFILIYNIRHFLLSKGLYRVDERLLRFKKIYSLLLLGKKKSGEKLNPTVRKKIFLKYKEEIEDLEKLIDIDLSIWKY